MNADYFKEHLSHYSYYRYMAKTEPETYTPLYNMVKKWLYFLPKRERKILFLRYCLHRRVGKMATDLYCYRSQLYKEEQRAFQMLINQFYIQKIDQNDS